MFITAAILALSSCSSGKISGKGKELAINPEVQVRAALKKFNTICSDESVFSEIYNEEFMTTLGETLTLSEYQKTFRAEDSPYIKKQDFKIEEILVADNSEKRRRHVDGYGDSCEMIIPSGEAAGVLVGKPAAAGKAREYARIGFHFKKNGLHYKIYRELRTCRLH